MIMLNIIDINIKIFENMRTINNGLLSTTVLIIASFQISSIVISGCFSIV